MRFIQALKSDIARIFTDVAQIDLLITYRNHSMSFGTGFFPSRAPIVENAMMVHLQLNQKTPLTDQAFQTWLNLFEETVNELFEGTKADEAKLKARNIAGLMKHKISTVRH
ncbi:MAG: hypothetical protein R2813_11810 [Flavobacteriales bacterium]